MVTGLLRAITYDVLQVASDAEFFGLTQAKRDKAVKEGLPEYPQPLASYLRSVSEEAFIKDLEEVLQVLGSGTSIIAESKRLMKSKNGFFSHMLDALKHVRLYENEKTELGRVLESFKKAGTKFARVLDRELQSLLLAARDEDSPIVQIATSAEVDTSQLPGIPSVSVQKPLLGGARMFYKGKLTDDSWRSRLTKVLTSVLRYE